VTGPVEAVTTIPVVAEQLHVTRERVATGKVRISKKVTRKEELVDEPVLSERIEIDRKVLNQVVDTAPHVRHEGDVTIIPLLEEVLVVEKRLGLREELHIRRVREESRSQQRVVLQSEHADVERIDERPANERSR